MFRNTTATSVPMALDSITRRNIGPGDDPQADTAERSGSIQSTRSAPSPGHLSPSIGTGDAAQYRTHSSRTLRAVSISSSSLTPAEAASKRADYGFPETSSNNVGGTDFKTYDDFVDCPYIPPVPTSLCLQSFAVVVGRQNNREVKERRMQKFKRQQQFLATQKKHEHTLDELRKWKQQGERSRSFRKSIKDTLQFRPRPHLPSHQDIIDMAKYYYPLRADVKVFVCDFGLNRFEKTEVPLGSVSKYFYSKPDWSDVRWIHAPLNAGLIQSSLEDRFLKGNRRITGVTNNTSWPYTQIEAITLQNRDRLRNKLDVQRILREGHPQLSGIAKQLDAETTQGLGSDILHDLEWRSKHMGRSLNYWETVHSDFTKQLTGGAAQLPDSALTKYDGLKLETQSLQSTDLYENAHVVRSFFRCFQRSDGFLLTFTGVGGVDYIDQNLQDHLRLPSEAQAENEECSSLGLLFEMWSESGTATWYKRNVDWLLIYILTEIAVKPTHLRNGGNAPNILRTYQGIVQDLKRKRYDEFKRKASVNLVREYLTCIDELTTMNIIFKNTRTLLDRLNDQLGDVLKGESSVTPDNENGEPGLSRVHWAGGMIDEYLADTKELLVDLTESLNALFQLRSIEQNELAIVADSQNKAILVFTGVTIVFLPLSFFTSYFGMNLKGIVDTTYTQRYFWQLCGTLGFVLFAGIALYAFKHKIRARAEMIRDARPRQKGGFAV